MKPEIIKIDKYETDYKNGKVMYYAVKGKQRYEMPPEYADMYNDSYLAIQKIERTMPELFDSETTNVYIPLKTVRA